MTEDSGISETSSTSSTSTSSGRPSTPLPETWHPIEIRAEQLTQNLAAGYSLALTFDHRRFIDQGSAPDGSDLAIVSRHGEVTTSLGRVLDPQSSWGLSDTKLWFAIDDRVSRGSTIDDQYFLVIGDTDNPPNTDSSRVFLDFDDFGVSEPDSNKWLRSRSSVGSNELTPTDESVLLTASPHITYPLSYFTLRKAAVDLPAGVRIDARTRFHNIGLSGNCGRIFPISLTSANNFSLRAGFRSDLSGYAGLSFNQNSGVNHVTPINAIAPRTNTWELHSLSWIGTNIGYWRNGSRALETQSPGSVTQPDQTPLHLELSAGAQSRGCVGVGQLGLEVDWIRVRRFVYPEPWTRLK